MHEMAKLLTKGYNTCCHHGFAPSNRLATCVLGNTTTIAKRNVDVATKLRILPWAMVYYVPIGPAVQHISAVMEQEVPMQIAPGSLVHTTRIGRGFLSRTGHNLARKGDSPFVRHYRELSSSLERHVLPGV